MELPNTNITHSFSFPAPNSSDFDSPISKTSGVNILIRMTGKTKELIEDHCRGSRKGNNTSAPGYKCSEEEKEKEKGVCPFREGKQKSRIKKRKNTGYLKSQILYL